MKIPIFATCLSLVFCLSATAAARDDGGGAPPGDQPVGWQAGGNRRGTWDIISNCLLTICPRPCASRIRRILRGSANLPRTWARKRISAPVLMRRTTCPHAWSAFALRRPATSPRRWALALCRVPTSLAKLQPNGRAPALVTSFLPHVSDGGTIHPIFSGYDCEIPNKVRAAQRNLWNRVRIRTSAGCLRVGLCV